MKYVDYFIYKFFLRKFHKLFDMFGVNNHVLKKKQ